MISVSLRMPTMQAPLKLLRSVGLCQRKHHYPREGITGRSYGTLFLRYFFNASSWYAGIIKTCANAFFDVFISFGTCMCASFR